MIINLEQYQQNLLTQIITWINRFLYLGILINSIWFFIDFWPTLLQNASFVILVLIGLWCKSLLKNDRHSLGARIYIAAGMIVMAAAIPSLGPFFALMGAIGLCFYVFIAILVDPKENAVFWGFVGTLLYLAGFTILLKWPIYEINFQTSDILGLYVFPMMAFAGFSYLGQNAIYNIRQALDRSQKSRHETEKSYQALSESQGALQRELHERRQIEQELRKYQHHLEDMVALRTARLEALHEFDSAILEAASFPEIANVTFSHIGKLIPCDFAWVVILDYDNDTLRILGRDLVNNTHPKTEILRPLAVLTNIDSYRQGIDYEVQDIHALDSPSSNEEKLMDIGIRSYFGTPIILQGELAAILSVGNFNPGLLANENKIIIAEVARSLALSLQQANLRESIMSHMDDLEASLNEKEILLREVHHRVKNNLQIISSILNLQAGNDVDPLTRQILVENQSRINAMALVHEKMYSANNLSQINLAEFIKEQLSGLMSIHKTKNIEVNMKIQAKEIHVQIDTAIPLGIIINELITNVFKHAFPDQSAGTIDIALTKINHSQVQLCVIDNGIGLQKGFHLDKLKSLGLPLIVQLAKQIGATFSLSGKNGTQAIVTIEI